MKNLHITASSSTPEIDFRMDGNLRIIGKSIPDADSDFWTNVANWYNLYLLTPANKTNFIFQLDYLNTSSSKEILHMLYRLNELNERGFEATVFWCCNETDIDMIEVGKDYEHMVKVPFIFECENLEIVN